LSEAAGTEAAGAEATGTEGAEAAGQQAAAGTETQAQGTEQASEAQSVEALPDWAQKIVRDARKEAGDYRTAAKTASDAATQSITEKLAAALGLKPEAAADPAALTQQLTTAQQEAADRARELAIYKAASAHGADPARLLDSNSFMTSVKGLDPADGDAVADAIKAAVTANQSLKAARAAGASGVELSGGTGEQGQITEQQLKTMTPEQIVQAQAKGLLRNLLG
jgi:hypothetical protein